MEGHCIYKAHEIIVVVVEAEESGRIRALSILCSQLKMPRAQFENLCTKIPRNSMKSPNEWSNC